MHGPCAGAAGSLLCSTPVQHVPPGPHGTTLSAQSGLTRLDVCPSSLRSCTVHAFSVLLVCVAQDPPPFSDGQAWSFTRHGVPTGRYPGVPLLAPRRSPLSARSDARTFPRHGRWCRAMAPLISRQHGTRQGSQAVGAAAAYAPGCARDAGYEFLSFGQFGMRDACCG